MTVRVSVGLADVTSTTPSPSSVEGVAAHVGRAVGVQRAGGVERDVAAGPSAFAGDAVRAAVGASLSVTRATVISTVPPRARTSASAVRPSAHGVDDPPLPGPIAGASPVPAAGFQRRSARPSGRRRAEIVRAPSSTRRPNSASDPSSSASARRGPHVVDAPDRGAHDAVPEPVGVHDQRATAAPPRRRSRTRRPASGSSRASAEPRPGRTCRPARRSSRSARRPPGRRLRVPERADGLARHDRLPAGLQAQVDDPVEVGGWSATDRG